MTPLELAAVAGVFVSGYFSALLCPLSSVLLAAKSFQRFRASTLRMTLAMFLVVLCGNLYIASRPTVRTNIKSWWQRRSSAYWKAIRGNHSELIAQPRKLASPANHSVGIAPVFPANTAPVVLPQVKPLKRILDPLSAPSRSWPKRKGEMLCFHRNLPGVLQDFLGVHLPIAAIGRATGMAVRVSWLEHKDWGPYDKFRSMHDLKLPAELSIGNETSAKSCSKDHTISWTSGQLPSCCGFDVVPTTALRTLAIPHAINVSQAAFLAAYYDVARDFSLHPRFLKGVPTDGYVVHHITDGGDSKGSHNCLDTVLESLKMANVPIVLVFSGPEHLLQRHFNYTSTVFSTDASILGHLIELSVLTNSRAIIQQTPRGWGRSSSVAAAMRHLPLINTDSGLDSNYLEDILNEQGNAPSTMFTCTDVQAPERFLGLLGLTNHSDEKSLQSVDPEANKRLCYDRYLRTGLGDRFGALLPVAALAHAAGTAVSTFWFERNRGSHLFYLWSDLKPYLKMPAALNIVRESEFKACRRTSRVEWVGGKLESCCAYDTVSVLAYQTLITPRWFPNISEAEYMKAYYAVGKQWNVDFLDRCSIPDRYVALHCRRGDKTNQLSKGKLHKHFVTSQMIEALHSCGMPVVLITDDPGALRDYGHIPGVLRCPVNSTKIKGEAQDLAILMHATAILQESPLGWSAYSSVVAMAKGLPLLNTDVMSSFNRIKEFRKKKSDKFLPEELLTATRKPEIKRFLGFLGCSGAQSTSSLLKL